MKKILIGKIIELFMLRAIIVIFLACFSYESIYAKEFVQGKLQPRKFVIVTASYNNIDFVGKYLDSIFSQKCNEKKFAFRVVYYDDASTDGTDKAIKAYKEKFKLGDKFCIIRNSEKLGPHANIYNAVHSCDDDEIVLIVDGDDWLARNDVLEVLYKVYSDPDVWMTYGQYKTYPKGDIGICEELPSMIIKEKKIRTYKWVTSHLRTFYAWLYKCIKIEDIMFEGKFVPVCGDKAIMYPMLEMAGIHSRFISEILYIYNRENQYSYRNSKKTRERIASELNIKNEKLPHRVIRRYIEFIEPYKPILGK